MRFAVALIAAALAGQAEAATIVWNFQFTFHNGVPYKHLNGTTTFEYDPTPGLSQDNIPYTVNWTADQPPHVGPLTAGQGNGAVFGIGDGQSFLMQFYLPGGSRLPKPSGFAITAGLLPYNAAYKSWVRVGGPPLPATSAVPEPASWAMMIAGFGLSGSALRRRRYQWAAS